MNIGCYQYDLCLRVVSAVTSVVLQSYMLHDEDTDTVLLGIMLSINQSDGRPPVCACVWGGGGRNHAPLDLRISWALLQCIAPRH